MQKFICRQADDVSLVLPLPLPNRRQSRLAGKTGEWVFDPGLVVTVADEIITDVVVVVECHENKENGKLLSKSVWG